MYPNLYYAFNDFFGVDWEFLKLFNSFGFFVAISFLSAAWILTNELKKRQRINLLSFTEEKILVGANASVTDLAINFFLGFILGYKIIGIILIPGVLNDPPSFILSLNGSLPSGVIVGVFFFGIKWWEKKREKLAKPELRTIRIWPHDRVGDMVIYAAIFGFSGAKIFHNLENWDDFVKNPLEALVSFSGLTFYGGLICAGIAILFYAKKHKVEIIHLTDSFAPALMLGYAIGRIGCHVSGDGDWGILNSAFVSTEAGAMRLSKYGEYNNLLLINKNFFIGQFGGLNLVRNLNLPPRFHLPDWLFAYNYPHNVISEGVHLLDCKAIQYCNQLPIPVFPTALYEAIICSTLFGLLQILGKYISKAGLITGIYFMLNGLERFFIEKIRVNTRYEHLPFTPTQAELISLCLIIFGGFIFVRFYLKKSQVNLDVS